jgi:unsaturated chondroitin disaccharide hydrolase
MKGARAGGVFDSGSIGVGMMQGIESSGPRMEALERRQLFAVTAGTGLQAAYFPNNNFTGSAVSRVDKKVYFDFAATAPPAPIAPTTYSVRWTGQVKPSFDETYTFYATADDGVRLWVNHKLLVDDWKSHAAREDAGVIALKASQKYDIQIEYFNNTGAASIQLWWQSASQAKSVVPTTRLYPAAQNLKSKIDHAFAFSEQQIATTIADLKNNSSLYPTNTIGSGAAGTDGTWATTDGASWTSGFFAGVQWQAYYHNPKKAMRLSATAWTQSLAGQTSYGDDMGFRVFTPWVNLSIPQTSTVLFAAADAKMAQWNSKVGMFRSSGGTMLSTDPAGDFAVLIDHSMDMQLLYWCWKETGNTLYRDRATAHLIKLAQNYVRPDGSTGQWGYYSSASGAFVGLDKKQGASSTSAWARGQGWAIDAYTNAYKMTKNTTLLATARKAADYYLAHMPPDGVPYWDFAAPGIPNTYRDTSAAAVAASGLVQLSQIDPDATRRASYRAAAETILNSLTTTYLAEGSTSHGILLHGAAYVPRKNPTPDNSLIYGDYYFLEAMNRYAGT